MGKGLKGITIEVDGDTRKLNKALVQTNQTSRSLQNELKGVNSLLKLDPNNTTLVTQKQKLLKEAVAETESKLKMLETAERQAAAAGKDINDEGYRDLQREIVATRQKLEELKGQQTTFAKLSDGAEKFKKKLHEFAEAHPKIKKVTDGLESVKNKLTEAAKNSAPVKAIGTAIDGVKEKTAQLAEKVPLIGKVGDAFKGIKDKAGELAAKLPPISQQLAAVGSAASKAAQGGFTVLTTTIGGTVKAFAAFSTAAAAGAVAVGKWALGVSMEFETSMSNVQALMGASADDMQLLSDKAKQMGESTKFTASETADAFGYMALAGWDAQQAIDGIDGVLNLAASAGMDLAQASDTVTDYLSAFSMEASRAGEMVDVMAYAQANSNTSAQQLAEAFQNVAANANAMGYDVQQTTGLLGAMADQGLKGSRAGTALAAAFRDMSDKAENGMITINGMKIAVADANGDFRDMTDILADVETATEGLGTAERTAALSSVFTANSIKGVNLMLNAGSDSIKNFTDELYNAGGSAAEQAAIQMDNLAGDITLLKSNVDSVALSLGEELSPAFRDIVQTANEVVSAFKKGGIKGAMQAVSDALPDLLTETTGFLKQGTEAVGSGLTAVITSLAGIAPTMIKSLLPVLMNSFFGLLSSLIGTIPTMLPQLLDAAIMFFMGLIDGLNTVIPQLTAMIPQLVTQISAALTANLPQIIQGGIQILVNLINGITQAIPSLIQAIVDLMPVIVQSLAENLPLIIDAGLNLLLALVSGIVQAIPQLIAMLPTIIQTITSQLLSMLPQIIQTGIQLLGSLVSGITQAIPQLIAAIPQIISSIVNTLIQNLPQIISTGIQLLGALTSGIIQAIPSLVAAIPQVVRAIFDTFKSVNWGELGTNIIAGIKNGVVNAAKELASSVAEAAKGALDSAKRALGIHSPSTVFRDQVGKQMAAGTAIGFEEEMEDREEEMAKAIPTTFDSYMSAKTGKRAADAQAAGEGNFTQNVTINSPRELSPSETARKTRDATRSMILQLRLKKA